MSAGDPWVGTVIDVSKWQSSLPDLTDVIGVIARAGIGTKPDAMFESHIAAARKAKRWVGSYWYNIGSLTPSEEVNAYIAREQAVGGVSLHVIDWEGVDGFTAAQTAEFIRLYKARTGDPIGLYASESRFRDLGQDFNWIANYSREPVKDYDMWQYGPFRGVDGNNARDRIIQLVTAKEPVTIMRDFTHDPATAGSVQITVNGPGHYYLRLEDGTLHGAINPADPTWQNRPAYGPILLTPDIDGKATTGERAIAYLLGTEAAAILAVDVTVTKPTIITQADLDAAVAAQAQADQLALNDAVSKAVQLGNDTEQARIKSVLGLR